MAKSKKTYQSIIEQLQDEYEESYQSATFKGDRVSFGFGKLTEHEQLQFNLPVNGRAKDRLKPGDKEQFSDENTALGLSPSSTIQSAAYFTKKQYLIVSFKSGGTYSYNGVPVEVVQRWESASSAGSYFYYNIRTSFPYSKMG